MKMSIHHSGIHLFSLYLSLIVSFSPRSTSKFLSPVTCPSTPSNDLNNGDLYVFPTPFDLNKSSTDDPDHDNQNHLLHDDLQSSSKDGKYNQINIFIKNFFFRFN